MFEASKELMSGALSLVAACVSAQHTIPIYSFVKVEGEGGDVWITGSDGDVTVSVVIETKVDEYFGFCVPGKQFIDLVSMLGGDFTVEKDGTRVLIKHGRARHRLPFQSESDYPELPGIEGESLTIPGNLLRRMMEASEIAIDTKPDGKFPAMRGLHVSVSGGWLHIVGCDGVRLAVASHVMEGDINVIIPHKAVTVFGKFADGPDSVELIPQQSQVSLRGPDGNVISRLLVGAFPDWKLAIPQNFLYTAELSVPALILAIRRVGLASNIRDSQHSPAFSLKFTFTSKDLKLEAQSAEKGEALEYIDIECPGLEGELVVGVAGRQVLDFLAIVHEGHLLLDFRDAVTGLQFRPKQEFGFDYKYITMPVALKW